MIVLTVILLLIFLLLMLRVGVDGGWDGNAFFLSVKIGAVRRALFPGKEKERKRKNRRRKKRSPKSPLTKALYPTL